MIEIQKNGFSKALLQKLYLRIWSLASKLISPEKINPQHILNSLTTIIRNLH